MNQSASYVNTMIKGTFGYMDPDYFYSGRLTRKSDVYAFGVVLLEVLCRKRAVDRSLDEEQWNLVGWAQDSIKEGKLKHIIDSDIRGEISTKCLKEFACITQRCLHTNPKKRPTMAQIVVSLESLLILQEETKNSLQTAGRTIFGTVLNLLPFISKREVSVNGESQLSSNSEGNNRSASNTLMGIREAPEDTRIPNPSLKVFQYADLEITTRSFSADMLLGKGGFGEAFIGWIDKTTFAPSTDGIGITVVVKKRYQNSIQGHAKWLEEVTLLGRLAHPNIVSLVGYCNDECKYFLVYEYLQNRSFDHFLYKNASEPLSWGTRLRIMIGVARGLTFLHSSKEELVCCGVKSSDILLDQDFNAKLVDFGVARFCAKIRETVVATVDTGQLSVKTDIKGFGVVLLETLTGLQAWDAMRPDEQHNLVYWASPIVARKERNTIMDPRLDQKLVPSNVVNLH